MRTRTLWTLTLAIGSLGTPAFSEEAPRYSTSLQTSYNGRHPDLYAQNQERVRLSIYQGQLEVTSRLGLFQYKEGFRCPLTVRFEDAPAAGVENALAYVRMYGGSRCGQEMVVNLDVIATAPQNFDQIFYHEMTHAVLNDAIVFETGKPLPAWVQEGLAVYISGEGEKRVREWAQQVTRSQAQRLLRELEDRFVDYPGNYLAFKYLEDKHSINALQGFVRYLIEGKETPQAVFEATGLAWDQFRQNVKDYALSVYQQEARRDF